MGVINYIRVAQETIELTKLGYYKKEDQQIPLLCNSSEDFEQVIVYDPETLAAIKMEQEEIFRQYGMYQDECQLSVIDADSFEAAYGKEKPLVMNFANAHCPGGGFLMGSSAQEECLCRCSTLYASISSKQAKQMYLYNSKHLSPVDSDYMLVSPHVCVFRDRHCELLESPYLVGVVTIPAPNKYGKAVVTRQKVLEEVMKERLRKLFLMAAKNGYKTLVLGAWGCGAFGHQPKEVAKYFYDILIKENYKCYFKSIVFAILHGGKNLAAFQEVFMQ